MSAKGVVGLNVYKKIAIIRKADDVLVVEQPDGTVKTISDLHLAGATITHFQKAKPKHDIPVPKIKDVEAYKTDITPEYDCPVAYVRYRKPSHQELRDTLEYVVDAEDEVWLHNNSKFGGGASSQQQKATQQQQQHPQPSEPKHLTNGEEKRTTPLPLNMLEIMMDVMEKVTAFEAIITRDQAEHLILQKLPQLYHMYPIKARAGVVTIKHVLNDVYNYWMSKRSKLKRPLLRRFWPVTSSDDTNPHLVFRPREKEKYKLRKKRQNDMDAYRKMEQLKHDFAHVKVLCELVKQREELHRALVLLQREWFQQKIYDAVDTSGQPRTSTLNKNDLNAIMSLDSYMNNGGVDNNGKKRKSRSDGPYTKTSSESASSTTLDPAGSLTGMGAASGTFGSPAVGETPRRPMIIAGQNHGEPSPNFLNPLSTRETFASSWAGVPPHVTTFVNAKPLPTFRFRHRPRVGRGGRLCIDRMPLPVTTSSSSSQDAPTPTFYRAGNSQVHPNEPKRRLIDLLPPPLDRERLSQQLEAIALTSLKEDYEMPARSSLGPDGDDNDGEVVLVKMNDWLSTDDQLWGEERYAIGPI